MTIKFGIIGAGEISNRFARVLNTVEGTALAAAAARDPARADAFAHKYGAKKAYSNYVELIRDPDVDVVYIGLTNHMHYEVTQLCLENHKPVLCEKPLSLCLKDAEELAALARTNQTFLMEAMWTRCMPAYRLAKDWIRLGRIGEVKLISANFCYKADYDAANRLFNPALGGGSLFDVGVYPIEFATGILEAAPSGISGAAKIATSGVDEAAAFSLSFDGGALASLTCGFNVDLANEAGVYGTRGHIVFEDCYGPQWCELYDEENRLVERFEDPVADGFEHQIRHCADLVRAGKLESDLIPLKDTIECARIFDTLRRQWGLM